MGEIAGVGLVSHVPTIMMTKEQRYALNEGKEISLVTGLQEIRRTVLEPLKPDVVIVIDT
ncbi:MAG TPA: catechol 1,2-dioxygenase, partial [Gammaproteobacteria bacterium]|nr:catechol 1,2-dioxygenase [Gammaproteobacteria bacterium]